MDREFVVSETCWHCGDECKTTDFLKDDHQFCCQGCVTVYELLNNNELCDYYSFNERSGNKIASAAFNEYEIFDNPDVLDQYLKFKDGIRHHVTLKIPGIHCSSCVYLLENLHRLDLGVIKSEISFLKKELYLVYDASKTNLRSICELLGKIGYAPLVNNDKQSVDLYKKTLSKHYIKLSIAGFAFGNVMMFSFPEYVGGGFENSEYKYLFPIINLFLSIPVLLYSATDYYKSAWQSIKQKQLNLDVPITLGIFALFLRSLLDIYMGSSIGFFDSFCGFVFFLLTGKTFQMKFYEHLNFERNYRSYFPLAVNKQTPDGYKISLVDQLKEGDVIRIRNSEIIPCDSELLTESADIDYAFVTGENHPVHIHQREKIYAGGRVIGLTAELLVRKNAEKSYLNQLWSKAAQRESSVKPVTQSADIAGRYFSYAILVLAALTFLVHLDLGWLEALSRMSAVAIVACPCALALSAPFTFGTASGLLARTGFFFKDAFSIERFSKSNILVFDKTGTLTSTRKTTVIPHLIADTDLAEIKSIFLGSMHPMSKIIADSIRTHVEHQVTSFQEHTGLGLEATVKGHHWLLGSQRFLFVHRQIIPPADNSGSGSVYVSCDGHYLGYFDIRFEYRDGLQTMLKQLEFDYPVVMLSGDKDYDRAILETYLSNKSNIVFNLSPSEKADYIEKLNKQGLTVMIGDGLNDSAALQTSSVGIAVVEEQSHFTPSCDAIIAAERIPLFDRYMKFAKSLKWILYTTFSVSILYNSIGLFFAFRGELTPLISAILMPLSSVTVISIAISLTTLSAYRRKII